ncbi:hypothetical protein FDP41_011906 [Naegleria fowleri]|uniref:B30.2/SPRY domain-containing protein n=1 Tax=Naegleria fowleri TaxID=5763 RepID=A0A6A5C9K4_NAEFO|nr:uncharacterized protein FDP41_011906 [Naegleria fowleri]KAF0982045.1 hypothetical protein FDP41_011906 [Naegleria fowleri]
MSNRLPFGSGSHRQQRSFFARIQPSSSSSPSASSSSLTQTASQESKTSDAHSASERSTSINHAMIDEHMEGSSGSQSHLLKKHPSLLEDSPSCFNIDDKSNFIKVDKNMVTIRYTGRGNQQQEIGSIRSNVPFSGRSLIDYFEVQIICAGDRSSIMIGLTDEKSDFVNTRHPGYDANSFGLFGLDGAIYTNSKKVKPITTKFADGDVIGCGVNYNQKNIFFTKNGTSLGVAFQIKTCGRLVPTVGMHSKNEVVKGVFSNFLFDLDSMIENERKNVQQYVDSIKLFDDDATSSWSQSISDKSPSQWQSIERKEGSELDLLVRDYLFYCGFSDTLKIFEQSAALKPTRPLSNMTGTTVTLDNSCETRKIICKLIEAGEAQKACIMIEEKFPECLNEYDDVRLRLYCQIMIEMLKNQQVLVALQFSKQKIARYIFNNTNTDQFDGMANGSSPMSSKKKKKNAANLSKLALETVGLLAFNELSTCPFPHLLSQDYRNELSSLVNQMLLAYLGEKRSFSSLETCVRQLDLVRKALIENGSGNLIDYDC